jgi:alpha-glucosidase
VWSKCARFELFAAEDLQALVGALSNRFGRQPPLPDWAIGGAIIGLKDGVNSFERLEHFIAAGAAVSGLWCEDWAGVRETSFGRRLFWDWRRSDQRYPDLSARIATLKARGIRFLAYANPYLAVDGSLYEEARAGGHFCLKQENDAVYLVDFGEFDCGVLDFTREATREWFAERILGREMLDIGIDGWMADFGEYLASAVGRGERKGIGLTRQDWRRTVLHARRLFGCTGPLPAALGWRSVGRFHPARRHRHGDYRCALCWAGRQCLQPFRLRRLHLAAW